MKFIPFYEDGKVAGLVNTAELAGFRIHSGVHITGPTIEAKGETVYQVEAYTDINDLEEKDEEEYKGPVFVVSPHHTDKDIAGNALVKLIEL